VDNSGSNNQLGVTL